MENSNFNLLAYRITSDNIKRNPESLIPCLYTYYAKHFNPKAEYIKEANNIINRQDILGTGEDFLLRLEELTEEQLSIDEYRCFVDYLINKYERYNRFSGDFSVRTPDQIVDIVSCLIDIQDGDVFVDEGSGKGIVLKKIGLFTKTSGIHAKLNGVELNPELVSISKMYLEMMGIEANIIQGDVLKNEILPDFDKGYVFPPYGGIFTSTGKDYLSGKYGNMFNFKANSEWMFLFRMLLNLKKNGRIVALLPAGVLFRNAGKEIRKYLIENELIEGIINLPNKVLYPYSGVSTILMILGNGSKSFKMLNATNEGMFTEELNGITLNVSNIMSAYDNAQRLDYQTIVNYDYNLNPSIYFGADDTEISYATQISEVCTIDTGSQYTVARFKNAISEKPTEYQILTSSDIQNGLVDYDSLVYIEPDKKLLKFALEENDIVVTTKSTKVKTFVARDLPDRKIIVTGGMIILHPDVSKIDPTFLKMFLDSSTGARQMQKIMQGVTIKTISIKDFTRMLISCPPLEKQKEYSKKYNSVLAMYGAVQEQLMEIQKQLDNFYEDEVKEED